MARALSTNMVAAAGQVAVQTLVLFFLYRYLLDSIGVEQLGIWDIVLATVSTARVSELGLTGSVTKFVAGYRAEGNDEHAREAVQTAALSLGVVLGLILLCVYPVCVRLLPEILPPQAVAAGREILPAALLSLWFGTLGAVWMAALDGYLRSDLRATVMISVTLLHFGVALASVSRYGLMGLAAAQVLQGAVLFVGGWLAVRRVAKIPALLPLQWCQARFRDMLSYGANFQLNSVMMLLFEPITKVLLGRYGEIAAAGYFELAQRLVARVRALIVETNRVIVPVLAGLQQSEARARELYSKNLRYLFLLLTPLFCVLLAVLPGVSEVWIGDYQGMFVTIAICLSVAWYVNSMTAPAYFAYLGSGKLRWITISHSVMGGSNIVLGVVWGRLFDWVGVIAAFSISLALGSLITMVSYQRQNRLGIREIFTRHDLMLAVVCGLTAAAALALDSSLRMQRWYGAPQLWLLIGVAVVVMVTVALQHPLSHEMIMTMRRKMAGRPRHG